MAKKKDLEKPIVKDDPSRILDTSMEDVMHKFDATNAEALPVVDINNCLQGYILRTRMLRAYRQLVADFSAE